MNVECARTHTSLLLNLHSHFAPDHHTSRRPALHPHSYGPPPLPPPSVCLVPCAPGVVRGVLLLRPHLRRRLPRHQPPDPLRSRAERRHQARLVHRALPPRVGADRRGAGARAGGRQLLRQQPLLPRRRRLHGPVGAQWRPGRECALGSKDHQGISPTHPFLPYVAPHFSHISPFNLFF